VAHRLAVMALNFIFIITVKRFRCAKRWNR
jgi:hypothetical protein